MDETIKVPATEYEKYRSDVLSHGTGLLQVNYTDTGIKVQHVPLTETSLEDSD